VAECALCIDIGTTTVKAAVIDAAGIVHGLGAQRNPVTSPCRGWSEHVPSDTWQATRGAIAAALAELGSASRAVRSIAVTGPRGTVALLGQDAAPLGNLITWQDRRATELVDLGTDLIDPAAFYDATGFPVDPSAAILRLLWLRSQAHSDWAKARQIATSQGLVMLRLGSDAPYVDWTTAAMFGLLDLATLDWSPWLLGAFDIPRDMLPPLVPPGTAVGVLSAAAAADLGLEAGIPLVLAAADGPCGELGTGLTSATDLYGYLGTALGVSAPLPALRLDRDRTLIVMPGAEPGGWRVLALGLSGASAAEWFAGVLGHGGPADLDAIVNGSPPGAQGVTFVPALAGEGAPFWRPWTRGLFAGLSAFSTASDMARAVMEGVAIELRLMVEAFRRFGIDPARVRLAGGGSCSEVWCGIVANAVQLPILRMDDPNPSLRGAACYAFTKAGAFGSLEAASRRLASPGSSIDPDLRLGDLYGEAATLQLELRLRLGDSSISSRLAAAIRPQELL